MFSLSRIEPEDHATPLKVLTGASHLEGERVIAFLRVRDVKTVRCSPWELGWQVSRRQGKFGIAILSLLTVAEFLVDGIVEVLRRVRIRARAAADEHASVVVLHVQHLP